MNNLDYRISVRIMNIINSVHLWISLIRIMAITNSFLQIKKTTAAPFAKR